ncbi:MAG: GNAT family N-acetyltransferase [Rhodospirillaceae bacterium]|nr:GNAT family N-acetyltransferase [Rhodospirillaceae bacterium]
MLASIIDMSDATAKVSARLDGMFRLRHEVFRERLNWDVGSMHGRERDEFDDLEPVYIVCEQDGDVLGSWRLLPTTGPYMLKNVFPELLHGQPAPAAPDQWEISRFAVSKRVTGNDSLGTIRAVTQLLLDQLFTFAARRNLSRIVAVSDVRFERVLKRSGLITQRFGAPLQIGVTRAVAGYADVSAANLQRMHAGVQSALARSIAPGVAAGPAAGTDLLKLAA